MWIFLHRTNPKKSRKTPGRTWMISVFMNLRPSNFGGATLRGLGHMHPKLVQRSLLSDFSHVLARAALAEWYKASLLIT